MSWWQGTWLRLRALFSRGAVERELREELDFHLAMDTETGLERGLNAREARRQAMVKFGGVERFKEETRRARGLGAFDTLTRDIRISARMLRRNPVFTAAAVATLGLAIGANTAIFSVVDAVLVRPSPFPDPDRIVMVWETDRASGTSHEPASWPDVADFADLSLTLSEIGSMFGVSARVHGADGIQRVTALAVTPGLFETLRVEPLTGRLFDPSDFSTGVPSTVVLGEEYWEAEFGSDPSILGRTLLVNDVPRTVVGVLPAPADLGIRQVHARADYAADFPGGEVAIWFALLPDEGSYPRSTHPFLTMGRLSEGLELAAAQAELSEISAKLEAAYPENVERGVNLETYSEVVFGPVRSALLVLLGAVVLVLLVACANVANLLLARTVNRTREVAVRRALGAGGGQVRRQFLVEGMVLAVLGIAVGVVLAFGSLELLLALAPADLPRLHEARLDFRVLAATIVIGGGVALFFGLLPSFQAGALDMQQSLKAQAGRRSTEGTRVRRFRSGLMVAEVALAVTLVIGAGLLLRSFWELRSVNPGFDTTGIAVTRYELPSSRYPSSPDTPDWPDVPATNGFHQALLERVRALPGVEAAAVSVDRPLDAGFTNSFVIVGREAEFGTYPEIRVRIVSPGYLETLGVPLLAGRDLTEGDVASAPAVILINQAAAERHFGSSDPLGQELRWWGITRQIVGVIGDERFLGLESPSAPAAYLPLLQNPRVQGTLLARTTGDPAGLLPLVRGQLRQMDPEVPSFDEEPLTATLSESISSPRFTAAVLGVFAGLALLLALIGVHGVLTYSAAQRSPEVSIRMALGAERGSVVMQIVREGLGLAGIGVLIGVGCALAFSRLLQGLVYGVTATDPATYAIVITAVLAAAATASFFPAFRAARADPGATLRSE